MPTTASSSLGPTHASLANKTVVVAGGGLAGISAAMALARHGAQVTLLEARRRLGGRTGSFTTEVDGRTETVDYCQHVGMGCCTNLKQLIAWLGHSTAWAEYADLHFYYADGRYQRLTALPWVPAPLHLMPWLAQWPGLRWRDRLLIARGMLAVQRLKPDDSLDAVSALEWLQSRGQSERCLAQFWNTIIVSALGEQLDRVNLAAVVKVLQDGFLRHREAFHLLVPKRPLDQLFNAEAADRLRELGVTIGLESHVQSVVYDGRRYVVTTRQMEHAADAVVLAMPWHALSRLAERSPINGLSDVAERCVQLGSSPITGVHTWWDRPWFEHPQGAIVGRLCHWVFADPPAETSAAGLDDSSGKSSQSHYYQIVISASRSLPSGNPALIEQLICEDLAAVFPRSRSAKLLRFKVVTDPQAVFSVAPKSLNYRAHRNDLGAGIVLAGDWTRTGWPATMEGAILSGFRAAEALLESWGIDASIAAWPLHRSS